MRSSDELWAARETAKEDRKAGRFAEACRAFADLWAASADPWDGWGLVFCLRKTGDPREGARIAEEILQLNPDFAPARSELGWCLYELYLRRDDDEIARDESGFARAANRILGLSSPDLRSPHARVVFRVVRYLEGKAAPNFKNINHWLDKLDVSQLSHEAFRPEPDGDGARPREFASDWERWYSLKTKALLKLRRYEECLTTCEAALHSPTTFHADNDLWLRWRMAQCQAEAGHQEQAIALAKEVLKRKQDWFVHQAVAEWYLESGQPDPALQHAIRAVLWRGEVKMQVGAFETAGKVLKAKGQIELAGKHFLLAAQIRREQEWKVPAPLEALIADSGADTKNAPPARELHRELYGVWQRISEDIEPRIAGTITKVLPSGVAGFIRGDDRRDYYFRMKNLTGSPWPAPDELIGTPVTFCTIESKDRHGNDSQEAVSLSTPQVDTTEGRLGAFAAGKGLSVR